MTPVPTGLRPTGPVSALVIGASTGGPDALAKVIGALPGNLPVPVLVVQHMPPVFTAMFAERLNRLASVSVVEAQDGMPVTASRVYVAPGDHHLQVVQRGTSLVTKLSDGPPENSCRPAVDVLFRSAASIYGGTALATILTGMGQDGKRGAEELHAAGAEIVAQDEASSVVWGMPGAVVTAHLAHTVLPLGDIAQHLVSRITAGKAGRPKVVVP
jgi:two-component system chemotaxis response regulator CheB